MNLLRILLLGFLNIIPYYSFADHFDLDSIELYVEVIETQVDGISLEIKLINNGLHTLHFVDSVMVEAVTYRVWDEYGNKMNPNGLKNRKKKKNYIVTPLKLNPSKSMIFNRFFIYKDNELINIDKENQYELYVVYPLVRLVNGRRKTSILMSNSIDLFTGGNK